MKIRQGWLVQLFHAFLTPFNGVLFAVSVVSLFLGRNICRTRRPYVPHHYRPDLRMILLSTLLRFWQEFPLQQGSARKLKAMVSSTAAVLRTGMERLQEIPISRLVPGDIVYLSAGDMVTGRRAPAHRQKICSSVRRCSLANPFRWRNIQSRRPSALATGMQRRVRCWNARPPVSWAPTW